MSLLLSVLGIGYNGIHTVCFYQRNRKNYIIITLLSRKTIIYATEVSSAWRKPRLTEWRSWVAQSPSSSLSHGWSLKECRAVHLPQLGCRSCRKDSKIDINLDVLFTSEWVSVSLFLHLIWGRSEFYILCT